MQQIYSRIARQRRLESYFSAAHASALPDRLANSPPTSVLVFKDGTQYRFPPMPDEAAHVPVTTEPPPDSATTTPAPLAHPAMMAPMMDPFHPIPPVDMRLLANAPPAPTPPTPVADEDDKGHTRDLPDAHRPWADDLHDWVNNERCASHSFSRVPVPVVSSGWRCCCWLLWQVPGAGARGGRADQRFGALREKLLVIFVTMNASEMQETGPRALLNASFKHFADLISRQRDRFHKCAIRRHAIASSLLFSSLQSTRAPRHATPNIVHPQGTQGKKLAVKFVTFATRVLRVV